MRYVGFLTAIEVLSIAPPLSALSNSSTDDDCYTERKLWCQGCLLSVGSKLEDVIAFTETRSLCMQVDDVDAMWSWCLRSRRAGRPVNWGGGPAAFVSHQQAAVLVSHKESGSDDALLFVSGSAVFACHVCLQEKGMKKKIRLFVDTET